MTRSFLFFLSALAVCSLFLFFRPSGDSRTASATQTTIEAAAEATVTANNTDNGQRGAGPEYTAETAIAASIITADNTETATTYSQGANEQLFTFTADNTEAAATPPTLKVRAEKLYTGLQNPWGMVWLPDGRMLITERAGEILVFRDNKFTGEKISGVPEVYAHGQGGLLDIRLHPDYEKNKWIYIAYSKPGKGGAGTTVMRFKLDGNKMVEKQQLYEATPYVQANIHFGCRIIFDKNNMMYISSGERGTQPKVQELTNDHGKIHRLHDDGRIPKDNPFVHIKGARGSIWTYGHRNPQGMVYDVANDRIWAIEHGPKGGDELNLIEKGNNYGWPKTSYGINYDGSILTPHKEMEGVTNPVHYWVPSIGPCGMELVTSDRYPEWKGNLLASSLSFRYITRVTLSGTRYAGEEKLVPDIGRVRDIRQGPDGYLYVITEGPGLLVRLVPDK